MALERIKVKAGGKFDPNNEAHMQALVQKVSEQRGTGWEVQSWDPETGQVTLTRGTALTEMRGSQGGKSFEVSLGTSIKPNEGELTAQRLEEEHDGYYLTEFRPHVKRARLTKMSEQELRCRDAIANVIGVPRWEVQVHDRRGGGFTFELPSKYAPSKHDDKLLEVAESVVGRPGWYVKTDARALRGEIIPAEQPTFEPVYPFDFAALPHAEQVGDKDLWRIPLGMSLGGSGEPNRPVEIDFSDSVGSLVVGLAGAGKDLRLDERIPVPIQHNTPHGWATVRNLKIGDLVYAADGTETELIGLSDIRRTDTYVVTFSDGQQVRASGSHLWKASSVVSRSIHTPKMKLRRAAHKEKYLAEAAALRAKAKEIGPGDVAGLSDIARLIGRHETSLYQLKDQFKHLAVGVSKRLAGTGGVPPVAYPVDEVITLLAERVERQSLTDQRNRPAMHEEQLVTTAEMMSSLRYGKAQRVNWAIRTAQPIDGPEADLPLDPYTFGVWLGDGSARAGVVTGMDREIIDRIEAAGFPVRRIETKPEGRASTYAHAGLWDALKLTGLNTVAAGPGRRKLDKRIPAAYLRASKAQRLALLQGIMDSDGHVSKVGKCEITFCKQDLAEDTLELVRSLGIKAAMNSSVAAYTKDDVRTVTGTRYRITFTTSLPVALLTRHVERLPAEVRATQELLYVTDIRIDGQDDMRCLKVAHPEHLYLTGGFIPTHNSVTVQSLIFSAKARGYDIGVMTSVDKATDFIWAKPFVKDHLWGCDSVAQAVAVAKLVGEEGERRGALLSTHGASKWQELPAQVKRDNPPLLLVADELAALLTADPMPSGLSKEMKELPEFVKMQQDLLESKLLVTALSKIPAVYRAAGIRVIFLTQQPNERYGFSTKLKGNLPHRVMLGVSPSQAEKGHAFRTPEKVPDVPANIAQDPVRGRGVGLAHLDGQEPAVFKGYFAPLEAYLAEAKRRGFRTSINPAPSQAQISRLVPRIDGEDDVAEGYGHGPRQYEAWELGPDGEPLTGGARANAAKHHATKVAQQFPDG
ncbi:hypothetical protein ACXR2T_07635 [Leucobacter sp. HY1910]